MQAIRMLWLGLVVFVHVSTPPVYAQPTDQPLTISLERSEIIGIDNKIRTLRVPALDANGAISYIDLNIEIGLTVNDTGQISGTAIVTPQPSPSFLTNEFVPGTYEDGQEGTCTLGVSAASGGRTAGALSCITRSSLVFNANWVTGPVAGHPLEPELIGTGIDQIAGAENVAWGVGSSSSGFSAYNCFGSGSIISVHQAGNVLAINNFADDNVVNCNYSFMLSQP